MSDEGVDDEMTSCHEDLRADTDLAPTTSTGNDDVIDVETGELVGAPDEAAFADFYRAQRPAMVRALGLALHDPDFGAEAADEAFVRACQHWPTVQHMANPAGWVYRVAMNWATSVLRSRRRHRAKQALVARSESTTDRTRDLDLELALSRLGDAHRAVVVCRYYLDWSVDETAAALGIAPGTVKSRLARALAHLEADLSTSEPTSPDVPSAKEPRS